VPECPVEAIFPEEDLPAQYAEDTKMNADYFRDGPGFWKFDLEAERVRS
jgi:hypothetical protein